MVFRRDGLDKASDTKGPGPARLHKLMHRHVKVQPSYSMFCFIPSVFFILGGWTREEEHCFWRERETSTLHNKMVARHRHYCTYESVDITRDLDPTTLSFPLMSPANGAARFETNERAPRPLFDPEKCTGKPQLFLSPPSLPASRRRRTKEKKKKFCACHNR